ncbi:hypothetical protein [Roseateles depolymerans]|uniref:Uncharacterized protein n=1 Tax=Roseateles depolymerans TaxID=76731 RepID=A0A0U3LMY2_9BURK|nr:hypothetical protein [Roseateles depolymerans]ALV07794.1 hypothetical protein RD2015_3336 [Roseateles depolymerans]REG21985.1 hypothetical protein DES44_1124 [Roseateles depolymerans]
MVREGEELSGDAKRSCRAVFMSRFADESFDRATGPVNTVNLEIDVLNGRVLMDGNAVWAADGALRGQDRKRPIRCLDRSGELLIGESQNAGTVVTILFDEEEFPDSILTSSIVKRFVKKTGVLPVEGSRASAVATFPWGTVAFWVDPKQGDLSITVAGLRGATSSPPT